MNKGKSTSFSFYRKDFFGVVVARFLATTKCRERQKAGRESRRRTVLEQEAPKVGDLFTDGVGAGRAQFLFRAVPVQHTDRVDPRRLRALHVEVAVADHGDGRGQEHEFLECLVHEHGLVGIVVVHGGTDHRVQVFRKTEVLDQPVEELFRFGRNHRRFDAGVVKLAQ